MNLPDFKKIKHQKVLLIALQGVGVVLLVFIILNFSFFWKQLEFYLSGHTSTFRNPSAATDKKTMEPNLLVIESLNIKVPIIYVEGKTEKIYQEALKNGVVHYPGTANIGELGNAYIFGHSSDYVWSKGEYKTIFALLPKIKTGDEIVASNQAGEKFIYKVIETKVIGPKDLSVLDQQQNKRRLLTLQTSYPLGTALKRFIVVAELLP
jgi:sortase A